MIHIADPTVQFAETKSQRKELKLKPSVAAEIQAGADVVGMDMSTFMASAAYRLAQEVTAAQHRTTLPPDAFDAFAKAVDGAGTANPALTALFEKRRALLKDG
jgi:uncharacterized protein (DUF1778 family)